MCKIRNYWRAVLRLLWSKEYSHATGAHSITAVRLHHASGCITRARCRKEFASFKNILTCGDCPEYGGFNTKICREQGRALEPKTTIVYLALIDKAHADPSTIMTAMVKVRNYVYKNTLKQLYYSFVYPYLIYGIEI